MFRDAQGRWRAPTSTYSNNWTIVHAWSFSDVNRNDYRAWNGLGQAYEILGLNGYCIYYYSRAAQLKPDDSRMLVSLGEAYEKMDKIPNALKCYYKAHSTGDIEGMALFKLAKYVFICLIIFFFLFIFNTY